MGRLKLLVMSVLCLYTAFRNHTSCFIALFWTHSHSWNLTSDDPFLERFLGLFRVIIIQKGWQA